ncbi:cory-CC-star protein [Microbacterium sp. ARD32]|uniref:cory-CC-star protein n=1 Tax=Microbacterium sp. ARD32 TaxID=2962577 RepID=UPI00288261AF|nr:cory-CC-star protein [Microbacterium sp. ARD32]MDT0157450.1 cory-CC-star protein [Microbacterium sp. ARD32]
MPDSPVLQRVAARWRTIQQGLVEYYAGPYRQTLAREQRDEDDLFALIVLGEALGVPDPSAYYSAELMPLLAADFHAWHRRMGMPRSPLDAMSCC